MMTGLMKVDGPSGTGSVVYKYSYISHRFQRCRLSAAHNTTLGLHMSSSGCLPVPQLSVGQKVLVVARLLSAARAGYYERHRQGEVGGGEGERERERERETETDRQTDRQTDRDIDTETDRDRQRQTDRDRKRCRYRHRHRD